MPEGDTLHKLAGTLGERLGGRRVDRLWLRDGGEAKALAGAIVREVASLGKHLLLALCPGDGPDWVLHVHLGMYGRWHRYRPGERQEGAASTRRLELECEGWVYVCFRASQAELLRRIAVPMHRGLARLGPDLLGPEPDFARIVSRARARGFASVSEMLLDQGPACGIGNVYRNEVLFLEGVPPLAAVEDLSDDGLERLYRRARTLMQWNLGGGRRVTVAAPDPRRPRDPRAPRHWVYRRSGRPCLRCGTLVRRCPGERGTWLCPRCQPQGASGRLERFKSMDGTPI